jgi:pumilio homology domain family member 6
LLEQEPLKKASILRHMKKTIHQVLEKASFNLGKTPILHRAILDYLNVAPADQTKDTIELLKEHLVHMLHTREGALITRYCILHASPKDRKLIIKSFKGFVPMIAREQYGHVVLLTCFECIDDTVLVGKAIIQELFVHEKVNEFLRNLYGSRVVLYLLSGRSKRYQPAYVLEELRAADETRALTTKKDHDARHEQNLEMASPLIVEAVSKFANELLRDKTGSTLLIETCNSAVGPIDAIITSVLNVLQESKQSSKFLEPVNVVKKMKQEKDLSVLESQGLDMNESIVMNRWGSLTIKNLLRKPANTDLPQWKAEMVTNVWDILQDRFVELINQCAQTSNASGVAFIFVALFEFGDEKVCREMSGLVGESEKAKLRELAGKIEKGDNEKKRKSSEDRKSGLEILLSQL